MGDTQINIKQSIQKLNEFCTEEKYIGYSLYDSHNSPIPFHKLGHKLSFLINQIIKRSIINFRPLIGVRKEYNPKGIGLFLNAYTNIKNYDLIEIENIDERIEFFFQWLTKNFSTTHKGKGWGYHYDWPKSDGTFVPKNTPLRLWQKILQL